MKLAGKENRDVGKMQEAIPIGTASSVSQSVHGMRLSERAALLVLNLAAPCGREFGLAVPPKGRENACRTTLKQCDQLFPSQNGSGPNTIQVQ